MSLADLVRSSVAVADRVTRALQVDVEHEAWIGQSSTTKPTYAAAVNVKAIVEQGPKALRTPSGETIPIKAVISILHTIADNGAAGRKEPIDPRDRFTLPDGTVGAPILGAEGLVDTLTEKPYAYTVALG